jgi:hypothetical protein
MGGSETLWRMVEELGIEHLAVPSAAAADNRFIFRDGKLMPLSFGGFRNAAFVRAGQARLMAEPFIQ